MNAMKKSSILLLTAALTLGAASLDADAARRFGGGGNLGKQRATPAMKEAPSAAPSSPSVPAKAGAPAPAGAPAAAPAQPGFMGRWGGMLAGLGIGALLGSMFGGHLGGGFGLLLMLLVFGAVAFMVMRMLASRVKPVDKPVAFAAAAPDASAAPQVAIGANLAGAAEPARAASNIPPDFQVEPFLRQAKMAFIRLQAANDAKDLADIRDYTTPEMYAEIAMQIEERLDAVQKTEVVNVHPTLVEVANEDGYEIASVRFAGLLREAADANPQPFDEVWHVRKKVGDKSATWLIAGIQQLPQ